MFSPIWLLKTVLLSSVVIGLEEDELHVDAETFAGHPCDRPCVKGAPAKICEYVMNVELYNSLGKACYDCPRNATDCDRPHCISADGVEKGVVVVNR